MQGEFTSSSFVSKTVGVDNVCERSAVKAAENYTGVHFIQRKRGAEGVTTALVLGDWKYVLSKEKKIYVVGIGPGSYEGMTGAAATALEKSDVIVGYTVYIDLVKDHFPGKSFLTTPMRKEVDRCVMAFDEAMKDQTVSMICSGDAGVYGMAGLMYEIGANYPEVELEVVAGVTAATGGAAVLGAPLIHDFCLISLSDLLTPWEKIEKRLLLASEADFVIVLYNPSSHKRHDYLKKACELMLQHKSPETVCGTVQNINREG